MATINRRITADIEGDFAVFLIGMRINRPWKLRSWLPVFMAMPRMLNELKNKPELGLLHYEQKLGNLRQPMVIQYWRSFEQLEAYARSRDAIHFPEWVKFNKRVGSNGDVGIWHEAFVVRAGDYHCVYNNMPARGLALAGKSISAPASYTDVPQTADAG